MCDSSQLSYVAVTVLTTSVRQFPLYLSLSYSADNICVTVPNLVVFEMCLSCSADKLCLNHIAAKDLTPNFFKTSLTSK